ncbi:MAG: hypothetical protein ABSH20_23395 [Tepidisphaeraceae bacterium]|jgi:hypothetical protein
MNNRSITVTIVPCCLLVIGAVAGLLFSESRANAAGTPPTSRPGVYAFDGTISREVLENCLSRSITMEGLLNGRGDLDDNIRMLKTTGAKFIGRSLRLPDPWAFAMRLVGSVESY